MKIKRIKNLLFLCACEDCHKLISSYLVVQNGKSKSKTIGFCEDCSFELYQECNISNSIVRGE